MVLLAIWSCEELLKGLLQFEDNLRVGTTTRTLFEESATNVEPKSPTAKRVRSEKIACKNYTFHRFRLETRETLFVIENFCGISLIFHC